MSGTWRIGPVTALAQLQATIEAADAGPGPSKIRLYTTARHIELDGAAAIPGLMQLAGLYHPE